MAWKIIFSYRGGGEIHVSKNQKRLDNATAEYYRKQYAKPWNDGGMVYISPYKTCKPIPLIDYIRRLNEME